MDRLIALNKKSWNEGAEGYSAMFHSQQMMDRLTGNPDTAFHKTTLALIAQYLPDMHGKRVCVPSSGDNHAVFAFAMRGARVTSCDIAENQLDNARRAAEKYEWGRNIEYRCCDTRTLEGVQDGAYDFVYTSNGVHVWIDDLGRMYKNVERVLKKGGVYIMYEIHPFQRPFDDHMNVVKPYDLTGPFDDGNEINFAWRLMDIENAILDAGLSIKRVEEMYDEKDSDSDWPFFLSLKERLSGRKVSREEIDRMYDWHVNPIAALPNWLSIAAVKN